MHGFAIEMAISMKLGRSKFAKNQKIITEIGQIFESLQVIETYRNAFARLFATNGQNFASRHIR